MQKGILQGMDDGVVVSEDTLANVEPLGAAPQTEPDEIIAAHDGDFKPIFVGDKITVMVITKSAMTSKGAVIMKLAAFENEKGKLGVVYLVDTGNEVGVAISRKDIIEDQGTVITGINPLEDIQDELVMIEHHVYRGSKALPKQYIIDKLWKRFRKPKAQSRF